MSGTCKQIAGILNTCFPYFTYLISDLTSEIRPLQAICPEEIVINCCQHQHSQEHDPKNQHPLVQPTDSFISPSTQKNKIINRSQSTKDIEVLKQNQLQQNLQPLKQQQSLPSANTFNTNYSTKDNLNSANNINHSKSVSILVYKTLNNVFKSSRKIVVRACEVASIKKNFNMFKFNKAGSQNRSEACTGHDQFVRAPIPEKKVKHIMKKLHKQNGIKRSNSAIEIDISAVEAANRRPLQNSEHTMSTDHDNSDNSEHSEKSPLVSARPNMKCHYLVLDNDAGIAEHSPREKSQRESALSAVQKWIQCFRDRYEVIAHLDKIGSRQGKNWFLVTDATVRTDRLLSVLWLPQDCIAFQSLSSSDSLRNVLMELLGSLHHPYIYPVLDLGFSKTAYGNYACLVTPFNSKGSLKDLIYKVQWNEPWSRKYIHKPKGLPVTQVRRLGRQILEALLFLKKRGFPMHGHLHSGNVILQNGAARLSGLENGLLGLCSRNNAVTWSRTAVDIEHIDIICFGYLLYEMCLGQELTTAKPSMNALRVDMEQYPQIYKVLDLIFQPPNGIYPTIEDLVLCDIFRSIDLRELQGPYFTAIQPSLSPSTVNLLHAVKKHQCASLDRLMSDVNSPCTSPSSSNDYRSRRLGEQIMSQNQRDTLIHLVAGGTAGTVGAVVTCPLEVVKTRLQSSTSFLITPRVIETTNTTTTTTPTTSSPNAELLRPDQRRNLSTVVLRNRTKLEVIRGVRRIMAISHCGISSTSAKSMSIMQCLKHIVQHEGPRALFKGLGPNIIGVAPSRAIYFCTYSQTKNTLNNLGLIQPESPQVHIMSAACAGFVSSSITNPIWFVKTRLQLDYNSKLQMTVRECIKRVYAQGGIPAFYKGITASYFGICETVVHFVIYEFIKSKLIESHNNLGKGEAKTSKDFLEFMLAGAISKTVASCIAYPHEVARTRLREEGNKYNKFWQTLHTVWQEEGRAGLYRGLATQLVRQIPNTAIMMATYEAVVYMLTRRFNNKSNEFYDF